MHSATQYSAVLLACWPRCLTHELLKSLVMVLIEIVAWLWLRVRLWRRLWVRLWMRLVLGRGLRLWLWQMLMLMWRWLWLWLWMSACCCYRSCAAHCHGAAGNHHRGSCDLNGESKWGA